MFLSHLLYNAVIRKKNNDQLLFSYIIMIICKLPNTKFQCMDVQRSNFIILAYKKNQFFVINYAVISQCIDKEVCVDFCKFDFEK